MELTDTLLVSTLKQYSLYLKIQLCKAGSFHWPKIWLSRLQIIHTLILSYCLEPLLLFIKEKSLNGSQQKQEHNFRTIQNTSCLLENFWCLSFQRMQSLKGLYSRLCFRLCFDKSRKQRRNIARSTSVFPLAQFARLQLQIN